MHTKSWHTTANTGIDSMYCGHVVLFDFPRDPSEYVRRVGRTARAGTKGVVTALVLGRQVREAGGECGRPAASFLLLHSDSGCACTCVWVFPCMFERVLTISTCVLVAREQSRSFHLWCLAYRLDSPRTSLEGIRRASPSTSSQTYSMQLCVAWANHSARQGGGGLTCSIVWAACLLV